jgi:hypothetical protein
MKRITHLARRFLACRAHGGAPLAVVERLAKAVPPLARPTKAANAALARYTDWRARSFDREHGTDTFHRVSMSKLGLVDKHGERFDNWAYGPICGDFFHEMMRHVPGRSELTLYDVGSGKGLPLMLAREHGFRRVVGIELSEELCQTARTNFESYSKKTGRPVEAEVICGDFLEHRLPSEPTAFFLNNPFPHYIAKRAIEHIERSVEEDPRRVVIAYRRMPRPTLEQLEASKTFTLHLTTPYWQIFATR